MRLRDMTHYSTVRGALARIFSAQSLQQALLRAISKLRSRCLQRPYLYR
nr:MAG TPA: hypothetical protein [Caudoviricetes sp.]